MAIKESIKTLLKTTEGIVVFGGLTLVVLSPVLSPEVWAIITAVGYLLVNVPGIITVIKTWYSNLKSGNTD